MKNMTNRKEQKYIMRHMEKESTDGTGTKVDNS